MSHTVDPDDYDRILPSDLEAEAKRCLQAANQVRDISYAGTVPPEVADAIQNLAWAVESLCGYVIRANLKLGMKNTGLLEAPAKPK